MRCAVKTKGSLYTRLTVHYILQKVCENERATPIPDESRTDRMSDYRLTYQSDEIVKVSVTVISAEQHVTVF